jgi:hypothetical protein
VIVLICPLPKSWTGRAARTLTVSEHPGTAVEWEGLLYEVRDAIPQADGGMRYGLAPWEEGHAIRRMERYDAVSEEIREAERRDRRHDVAKRRLSILFAPLAGLLPGEIQKKLERDFGAPAVLMTVASSAPLFVVGFLGIFGVLIGMTGAALPLPLWLAPPAAVAVYLFGESALRLASAIGAGEPMGTLAAALALAVSRAARKPQRATAAKTRPEALPAGERDARDRDLFHVLEPVLALLSPGEQETLVLRFGFDAIRWGRRTAGVLLAAAVLNTVFSLAALSQPDGLLGEILWSLPALYLAIEQVRRLRTLNAGLAAGSVLGRLVRPFARRLLGLRPL